MNDTGAFRGSLFAGDFLRDVAELDDPERRFPPDAERFARVTPDTGAALPLPPRRGTDRGDIRYICSTFPIVERDDTKAYGRYLTRDLCLAWMNTLAAGRPDAGVAA